MKTFGEVTAEVLRFGFSDGPQVNKARIEDWINEGQTIIARQIEGPEFQASEELTMVTGKYKYTLPTGCLRIQDIRYPELLVRLRPTDLQQFDMRGNVEGPPNRYTIWSNELWLYPTPNVTDKDRKSVV